MQLFRRYNNTKHGSCNSFNSYLQFVAWCWIISSYWATAVLSADGLCSRCWRCCALCVCAIVWLCAPIRTSSVTACCQTEICFSKHVWLIRSPGTSSSFLHITLFMIYLFFAPHLLWHLSVISVVSCCLIFLVYWWCLAEASLSSVWIDQTDKVNVRVIMSSFQFLLMRHWKKVLTAWDSMNLLS